MHKLKVKIRSLLNVLGDGLGSFRDGVSGKFSGEDELDGRLDLSGWKGSSLVESDELWTFSGDSVEGVVDEGVHDVHGLLWDSDVGVDLLENLVDVDWESLNSTSSDLLVDFSFALSLGGSHLVFKLLLFPSLISSKFNTDFIWPSLYIKSHWLKNSSEILIGCQPFPINSDILTTFSQSKNPYSYLFIEKLYF